MARTTEQKEADEALTEAIQRVRAAYAEDDAMKYLLTDYVVVFAGQWFDPAGEGFSMVGHIYRDSDVPLYRVFGLIKFAAARIGRIICGDDDD